MKNWTFYILKMRISFQNRPFLDAVVYGEKEFVAAHDGSSACVSVFASMGNRSVSAACSLHANSDQSACLVRLPIPIEWFPQPLFSAQTSVKQPQVRLRVAYSVDFCGQSKAKTCSGIERSIPYSVCALIWSFWHSFQMSLLLRYVPVTFLDVHTEHYLEVRMSVFVERCCTCTGKRGEGIGDTWAKWAVQLVPTTADREIRAGRRFSPCAHQRHPGARVLLDCVYSFPLPTLSARHPSSALCFPIMVSVIRDAILNLCN